MRLFTDRMLDHKKVKSYINNAGLYLMASIIPSLLSVIINPLLASNLSPYDYAVIAYYTSFGNLITPVLGFFAVDFFLRKYYSTTTEELRKIKQNVITFFIFGSGVISLLSFIGVAIFIKVQNVQFPLLPFALLVFVQLFVAQPYTLLLAEYRIKGDGRGYFKTSIFWGISNVLITLLFVVILKLGATGRLSATLLVSGVCFIWVLTKYKDYLTLRIDKSIFMDIFSFGWPLVLASMINFVSSGLDKVLLEKVVDIDSLGYYSVGCQIAAYLSLISTALKSTFQPDYYKAISQKNIKKVIYLTLGIVGLMTLVVGIFICFAPILVDVLTAGRYVKSTIICQILALSTVTSSLYFQLSLFTYGVGLSKITLLNKIIGGVFSFILLYFFIKYGGVMGAAWGTVISYLVYSIGNIVLLLINKKRII